VLQIHCGTEAIYFGADEDAREDALKQALIVAARGVASGRGAAIARGNEFKGLRLGRAHAASHDTQALCARLNLNDGSHEVALFAPKLEQAAAVGLGYGVAREAHVKENATIFEEGGGGMGCKVVFEDFCEFGSGWSVYC
jgi:hypothetical protein